MFTPVFLDHNSSTRVTPAALAAMLPLLEGRPGNASSRHEYGRAARRAIDEARQRVAHATGAHPTEVIFTSGGSESNNLFIKGAAAMLPPGLVAHSAVEHPCVREPAKQLRRLGWRVREIEVDKGGRPASVDFSRMLTEKPSLVSVMLANNETGSVQDIAALATLVLPTRAWFHSDAVQALGKIPVDFRALNKAGVHAISVSAHKIGGPKGAGALIVDKRLELQPLIAGGGQERGLRSGTENVAAIVGFGVACSEAVASLGVESLRLVALRQELEQALSQRGATIFAADVLRLPNTTCFSFTGIDGETLVSKLDRAGYAVASGAACSSANPEPSHVLLAMGAAPELARGAVRVSLGRTTVQADVAGFITALDATMKQFQSLTAVAAA